MSRVLSRYHYHLPLYRHRIDFDLAILDEDVDEILLGLLARDSAEKLPPHPPYRQVNRLRQKLDAERAAWARYHKEEEEKSRAGREPASDTFALIPVWIDKGRALRRLRTPGALVETQRLINPGSWTAYWKSDHADRH